MRSFITIARAQVLPIISQSQLAPQHITDLLDNMASRETTAPDDILKIGFVLVPNSILPSSSRKKKFGKWYSYYVKYQTLLGERMEELEKMWTVRKRQSDKIPNFTVQEYLANSEAIHQRWSSVTNRRSDFHRYSGENTRLRRCIIKWAEELEQGAEELQEKDMEQHGPGGKALGTGAWREGLEFERMRRNDRWMTLDAESKAWIMF